METGTMNKKETIKLINEAYYKLDCLNNISWTKYRDRLFDMNKTSEKQHDRGRPEGTSKGITITEAAKLFTVVWIAEYLTEAKKAPDAKDYINVRAEAFYAYSCAMQYKAEILKAWEGMDIESIASIDYADLMK